MNCLAKGCAVVSLAFLGIASCAYRNRNPGAPALAVSPSSLQFSATAAQQYDPPPATIAVANSRTGSLTFSASTDVPWLAVTPAGGNAPESLQVSAMIGALAPGAYTGHVIIKSDGVPGSPATIGVTFTIAPNAQRQRD